MVSRGNEGRIGRQQRSMEGGHQKIDCHLTAGEECHKI